MWFALPAFRDVYQFAGALRAFDAVLFGHRRPAVYSSVEHEVHVKYTPNHPTGCYKDMPNRITGCYTTYTSSTATSWWQALWRTSDEKHAPQAPPNRATRHIHIQHRLTG